MTMLGVVHRLRGEESGIAMIVAVVLLGVMGTLMALVLTVSTHTNFATGHGRSWVQALHVGEAGVNQAIAQLQATGGAFSGNFTGSTEEGNFSVTVTHQARNRFQIDATGTVGTGAGLTATRKIRVSMAPPTAFKYALFSNTTVDTKNNDLIVGDIWANQNVIVDQGDTITGSVTAATGYVQVNNGGVVTGDAWSGGFNPSTGQAIYLSTSATIGGTAKASVTAPTDPITCGNESQSNYKVRLDGGAHIAGDVKTWGTNTGSGTVGPPGAVTSNICTAAPATEPMPVYTYSPSNYDSSSLHEFGTATAPSATAVSDFQDYVAAHKTNFSGTFFVNQSGPVNQDVRVDLTNVTITGDTTIVTNTPIFTNGMDDNTTDAILTLVSTYKPPAGSTCDLNQDKSECSVHLKNNFDPSDKTAVLVYAPYGPVAVKNNQIQFGAVYADTIEIKNNQSMTYDSRIERVVGFGPETYVVQTWFELAP
jgi:hypothetical protein